MIRINLVPKEERGKSRRRVNWLRMGVIGTGGLTALMVLLAIFNAQLIGVYKQKLDGMAPQMAQLHALQMQSADLAAAIKQQHKAIDVANALMAKADNEATLLLLQRLIAVTPNDLWLTHLFLSSGKTVELSGYAAESADLTQFMAALQKLPDIDAVNLRSLTKKGQGLLGIREFSLGTTLAVTKKK